MNTKKEIWEGWTVEDFIFQLTPLFNFSRENLTEKNLKNWVKSNQPYYKKHIPEVYAYFLDKLKNNK